MTTEIKIMSEDEQQRKIAEFIQAFQDGIESWKQAGAILVELVESDPHVYDYITQRAPAMTSGMLQTIERVGRGQLLPTLAMDSSPGGIKLKGLPLSAQTRYETEPVPMVVETDNGPDILLVQVKNMTQKQARQAFTNGRLRTEGEQRAKLIEDRSNAARPVKDIGKPWKIVNGKLHVVSGVTFSAGELASILAQIAK